jgi:hypothetical protein
MCLNCDIWLGYVEDRNVDGGNGLEHSDTIPVSQYA